MSYQTINDKVEQIEKHFIKSGLKFKTTDIHDMLITLMRTFNFNLNNYEIRFSELKDVVLTELKTTQRTEIYIKTSDDEFTLIEDNVIFEKQEEHKSFQGYIIEDYEINYLILAKAKIIFFTLPKRRIKKQ